MNDLHVKPSKFKLFTLLGFVGLLIGLSAWALASPVGSSPDDDFHLVSSWCGAGPKTGLCESTSTFDKRLVPSGLINANCYAFRVDTSGACQGDINSSTELILTDRGSFDSNYPPLFYMAQSIFATNNITTSALSMRFLNIFVFLIGAICLFVFSPKQIKSALFWTLATTMIPLGWFLIASNNPSSWALTGILTAFFALHGTLRGERMTSFFFSILYFAGVLISAGARGDAGIYLSVVSASAIILWMPSRKLRLLVPAAGSIIGLVFFLSTKQANVASTGLASIAIDVAGRTQFDVLINNLIKVPALWLGAFGFWPLGWLDTYLPAAVWVITGLIFVLCVFLSFRYLNRKQVWLSIGLFGILYVLPIYVLQQGLNFVGEQVQPRYLLPLIVLLAAIMFNNTRMELGPFIQRKQLNVSIVALLAVANSLALLSNLNRYVNATGNWKLPLLHESSWWWNDLALTPIVIWGIGSTGFLAGLVFLFYAKEFDKPRLIG